MNLETHSICENQHQALSNYLESLLSDAPELSSVAEAAPTPLPFAAGPMSSSGAGLKCFVFTVAGLKLALPLARVTEVVEFSVCAGLPAPPSVLGQLLYENKHVPVLDSARIFLPSSNAVTHYQWLVIVDHGGYALACDSIEPNMEIEHEAVRWRTPLTKRRWLAGTLLRYRCALLDADEVYEESADNAG